MVCISKCRKYLFGGILYCFFTGIICQWAGVILCGTLIWHPIYWTGDRRPVFFISTHLSFGQIFDHFVCVCQACGSAIGMFVCVYSILLVEKYEVGRAFNLTSSNRLSKSSSTSETKSVRSLLLDSGIWSIVRVEILPCFPLLPINGVIACLNNTGLCVEVLANILLIICIYIIIICSVNFNFLLL